MQGEEAELMGWEIREIPIGEIRAADYNPRVTLKPGDREYDKLRRSIEELGMIDPLVWNERTGTLVGGHQRLTVLRDLGYTTAPCWIVSLTEKQEKQANVALNKIAGRWDEDKLYDVLKGFTADELAVTGFEDWELLELSGDENDEVQEDDFDVDESLGAHEQPKTKRGDVIALGQHRLMCGDATVKDDVATLFDGCTADMIFTDPPYNVDYQGTDGMKIMNDKMSGDKFFSFLLSAFQAMLAVVKNGGGIYVCHADGAGNEFRKAFADAGFLLKQILVWVKNTFVIGRQDYHWQHEPILYGWKPGAKHNWCGNRKQATAIRPGDAVAVEEDGSGNYNLSFTVGFSCIRIKVPSYEVIARSENGDVWLFDKPLRNKEHPTMKPVALCARAIINSSRKGDIVADLFGGGGATLIASEQLDRRCFMMELDPRYCDVIVDRWEKLTGLKAEAVPADQARG